ncbi:glycosyltransferase [Paenibacillus sp. FSL M7-1455]|uniref:glycosyltransferase n=1 Tax=Paenibacillus sp. FSL M7-1455 TaxID=2975316 RepID=UPI0030FABC5E
MKNILIISPTPIGKRMAGPSIRYWEISCQLAKKNQVVLLAPKYIELYNQNLTTDTLNFRNIVKYGKKADVIILQGMTLWKYPVIKYLKKLIAVDLYDPFHLENLEVYKDNSMKSGILYKTTLIMLSEQLKIGDYFFCASEKQVDYWLGMLTSVGRINVKRYHQIQGKIDNLIGIVPFGIPEEEPVRSETPISQKHPEIKEDDVLIVWGGGIWDWLDPETLLKAVRLLKNKISNIKCIFIGVKPPNGREPSKLKLLKQMARDLDLEGTVIFNEWVEYEKRSHYLLEASVGVSLHENHLETRFSYRTRILDYIWCNLPIVASEGDVFSQIVKEHGLGITVPTNDAQAVAEAIEKLILRKPQNYNKSRYYWSNAVKDLELFIKSANHPHMKVNLLNEIKWFFWRGIYYSVRIMERIVKTSTSGI